MRWLPETFVRSDGSVRKDWLAYTVCLVGVDGAAFTAALAGTAWLRPGTLSATTYTEAGAALAPFWFLALFAGGLYGRARLLSGTDEYAGVLQAAAAVTAIAVLADELLAGGLVARGWLVSFPAAVVVLAGFSRMSARHVAYTTRQLGAFRARIAIAGVNERALQLAAHLSSSGFIVMGFFDDFRPAGSRIGAAGWPVLGTTPDLTRASDLGADEVIVNAVAIPWESRRAILGAQSAPTAKPFDMHMLADREEAVIGHIRVTSRAGVPLYTLQEVRLTGLEAALKRGLDLIASIALLITLGPFAVARALRRLASGQHVLERHELCGTQGRRVVAYTLAGPGHRVISKLPAVAAVIRGHMSIVGPGGIEHPDDGPPFELRMMKPGLTSPIPAGREGFDEATVAAVQLEYVRNYSVWRDLQVLWHRLLALRQGPRDAVRTTAFWELRPYRPSVEQEP
jgi:lipopolysaccharide/colanic/teichoic acid biosynthesis glycosyltransferase